MTKAKVLEACLRATLSFALPEEEINDGKCFDWATIVFDLIEGSKIAGHNVNGCGHCWVEYKGLCYDAERPRGVKDWTSLPFWKRISKEAGEEEWQTALEQLEYDCK